MDEYYLKKFQELTTLHNDYADALKLVEQFVTDFDNTTLNDSRYALRAVIDCGCWAFCDNREKFDKDFGIAHNALRIAWHDIVDITLDEFKIYLDDFNKKYAAHIVASQIDVTACGQLIFKLEDAVRGTRRNRDTRTETYRLITREDLNKVLELQRVCIIKEPVISALCKKEQEEKAKQEEAREEARRKEEATKRREQRIDRIQRIGVAIAGIAALVAATGAAIAFYANVLKEPPSPAEEPTEQVEN